MKEHYTIEPLRGAQPTSEVYVVARGSCGELVAGLRVALHEGARAALDRTRLPSWFLGEHGHHAAFASLEFFADPSPERAYGIARDLALCAAREAVGRGARDLVSTVPTRDLDLHLRLGFLYVSASGHRTLEGEPVCSLLLPCSDAYGSVLRRAFVDVEDPCVVDERIASGDLLFSHAAAALRLAEEIGPAPAGGDTGESGPDGSVIQT